MPFTKLRQLAMSYRFEGTISPKRVFSKAKKLFRLGVGKMNHFVEMCRNAQSDADIVVIKEVVGKDNGKHNGENK